MPRTLLAVFGYSLLDSPAGLCAWIVEKIWAWSEHPLDLARVLSDDQVLDNVSELRASAQAIREATS